MPKKYYKGDKILINPEGISLLSYYNPDPKTPAEIIGPTPNWEESFDIKFWGGSWEMNQGQWYNSSLHITYFTDYIPEVHKHLIARNELEFCKRIRAADTQLKRLENNLLSVFYDCERSGHIVDQNSFKCRVCGIKELNIKKQQDLSKSSPKEYWGGLAIFKTVSVRYNFRPIMKITAPHEGLEETHVHFDHLVQPKYFFSGDVNFDKTLNHPTSYYLIKKTDEDPLGILGFVFFTRNGYYRVPVAFDGAAEKYKVANMHEDFEIEESIENIKTWLNNNAWNRVLYHNVPQA